MKSAGAVVLLSAGLPAKAFAMQTLFDDPMIREIYRRGVRDAAEFAIIHLPAIRQRALEDWLTQLDLWCEGNPPSPPHMRADASS
jgi:hypothetical protein